MYINKSVFLERDEIGDNFYQFLEENRLIANTDYGTTEILADVVQGVIAEIKEDSTAYSFTIKEYEETMKEGLGEELYNLLITNGIDFIQVLYT